MLELRAAGKLHREIAEEMGVSMPSVARILKERRSDDGRKKEDDRKAIVHRREQVA
jgi:hypothetical protein